MNEPTFLPGHSNTALSLTGGRLAGCLAGALVATLVAAASSAPFEVAASGLALIAIFLLLWRQDDPPILLLPPLYQWTEVAIVPISTVWNAVPLNSLSPVNANLESSALYGLLGVVALSLGLRVGMGQLRGFNERLRADAANSRFENVARWSFALIASGYFFAAFSDAAGPARELLLQVSGLKSVGMFMLAYWCLTRNSHLGLLGLVVGFEVLVGLTGFFAEFKNSLLVAIVAALAARPRLTARDMSMIGGAVGLLLAVAVFWTDVKVEYRDFVSRGSGEQEVLVPIGDRFEFIFDKAVAFTGENAADGLDGLINRHGYIEYLAQTMDFVPKGTPHENGALTAAALRHIAMPRFIFPGKPPLPSDTEIMALYTGQPMVWERNTSISIGHLAELYVDFGYLGGLLGMSTLGLILGLIYRTIRNSHRTPTILSAGLCLMAALPVAYFGTAYTKLVGPMVFGSLIAIAFQRFVAPSLLSLGVARQPGQQ